MRKSINIILKKNILILLIMISMCPVLGFSYARFVINTDNYRNSDGWGGGGGSGYYGGANGYGKGGAGGSSYISGYVGCVAITGAGNTTIKSGCSEGTTNINCSYHYSGKIFNDAIMYAGNDYMPIYDGTGTMIGNSGNGYAKITYVGNNY